MHKTARAIIKINDEYIFMRREKIVDGKLKIYYATIGGHLDNDESFEEACIREVKEEINIDVEIVDLFHICYTEVVDKYEKFYLVKHVDGKVSQGEGPEFTNVDIDKYGKYEIAYINKNDLKDYNILPEEIKEKLLKLKS